MNVYFFNSRDDVAGFMYVPEDFGRYDAAKNGTGHPWPDLATWVPLRGIEYCGEGEDGKPLRPSAPLADVTGIGGWLAVSQQFVNVLGDVLGRYGTLYPVDLDHRGHVYRYYCYACTNIVDCLDSVNSKGMRYREHPDRFRVLDHPIFLDEKIGDNEIFVLPCMEKGAVYVTERFKERIASAKLTGVQLYMERFNRSKDTRWQSSRPREAK